MVEVTLTSLPEPNTAEVFLRPLGNERKDFKSLTENIIILQSCTLTYANAESQVKIGGFKVKGGRRALFLRPWGRTQSWA